MTPEEQFQTWLEQSAEAMRERMEALREAEDQPDVTLPADFYKGAE